jgi:hypothetical protein
MLFIEKVVALQMRQLLSVIKLERRDMCPASKLDLILFFNNNN